MYDQSKMDLMVGIEGSGLSGDGLGVDLGPLLHGHFDYLNADFHHHHDHCFVHVFISDDFEVS